MNRNTIATTTLIFILAGILVRPVPVHAIIFLPAILIIPIAQLVAFLLGSFTLPVVITSFIWSKLFKKSWKRGLLYSVIFLVALGITSVVILKILNPDRPFF